MQEDDGEPGVVSALFIADVEDRGLDHPHGLPGWCLGSSATPPDSRGAAGNRRGAHDTRALQEISSALGHDDFSSFSLGNPVDYRHSRAVQTDAT